MATPQERWLASVQASIDAHNARIANVHTEVACPVCGQGVGQKCRHLTQGKVLKSPHRQRLRAAGIYER